MPKQGDYDLSYVEKLKDIKIEICEEYHGSKQHHKMRCLLCAYEWVATPIAKVRCYNKHKMVGCPKCTAKQKYENERAQNLSQLQERFEIISDYDGKYSGDKTSQAIPITVRNKSCGHLFTSSSKNLLTRDVVCPICNNYAKRAKFQQFNKDRHEEYIKTAELWDAYRHKVYMATRRTYTNHKDKINPDNLPRGLAGEEGAYHLDHVVPVRWCFEHYIPIKTCAHYTNLQMLHWNDNVGSRDRLKDGIDLPDIFLPYINNQ